MTKHKGEVTGEKILTIDPTAISNKETATPEGGDYALILKSGGLKKSTLSDIAALGGGGGTGYKVYRALLNQSGTDAPVATVLENTLGGEPVWTREGMGEYLITSTNLFTNDKTIPEIGNYFDNPDSWISIRKISSSVIRIRTYDTGSQSDDLLFNTAIEILVYL